MAKEKNKAPKIDESKIQDFSKKQNQLIALTALILAICATFTSLYSGGNSSKSILAQSQATNGWAYYQAKSIKQSIYESRLEMLEIDPPDNVDPDRLDELKKTYADKIARYEQEKEEIRANTQAKEAERDHCLTLGKSFRGALTYLQIAIMLTSLAGLMKQIGFWYAGIAVGAFGIFNFLQTMMLV